MGRDGGDADQEKRGGIWEKRGRASAAVAQAERVAQRTATARADILENFEFRNQIPRLSKADALGTLIEKLTSPDVNLSPAPVKHADGWVRYPGLDNHGMGSIFEELVRRFNEENNEEAGEHWTPRDAVRLMAKLVFLPVADELKSGTYLLYDGACGTGGMLTVAEETLGQLTAERGKDVSTHLFGQEINAETYAICTAKRGNRVRLKNQMERLFSCSVSLVYADAGHKVQVQSFIADRAEYWWDVSRPDAPVLWNSTIELGEKFFQEIIAHPIPIDMNTLRAMKRSSLGLDLYLWLTYRTFTLRVPITLTWRQLFRQFGADPEKAGKKGSVSRFRGEVLRELKKIKRAWPDLHYHTVTGALVLLPSPPSVPPAQLRLIGD